MVVRAGADPVSLVVAPDGEMVVATPERVAFNYVLAGLGTRFLAQVVDVLIIVSLLAITFVGVIGVVGVTSNDTLAGLLFISLVNLILFGYFVIIEGATSGLTPGKKLMRLRVVGDSGEPLTFTQAAIRNFVRLADFLPFFYAVGIVTLFANGRGKRLGDLAAGTVVVRERARINLPQLVRWAEAGMARAAQAAANPGAAAALAAGQARLDPALREFVMTYRRRRNGLHPQRRWELAESARGALTAALPDVVAREGTLAALDRLADSI